MSPILLVITAVLILYSCYSFATGKPKNAPPGIWRLPVWGSYWVLLWGNYTYPYKTLAYYVKKYKSKIISCYLGNKFVVIVNDYAGIKEVLTRREFDGRAVSDIMKMRAFGKKIGILFNDDNEWREQRRFALRNMRDFGFGRRFKKLEDDFVEELRVMLDTIDNGPINDTEKKSVVNGNLVCFPNILYPTCVNMIWSVMSGERLDRSEHEIARKFCIYASKFQAGADSTGGAHSITSWLRYFGNIFYSKDLLDGYAGMVNFIRQYIEKNKESMLADETPRGFLSTYLRKLQEPQDQNELGAYSMEQLLIVAADFMLPPCSIVPFTVFLCIKKLMHYPEVMKKVQAELDRVVGRERFTEWEDRKNLPFCVAAIREIIRTDTLTPLGSAHRATQDTKLFGYDIPVNTIMLTNFAAMHNDPNLWGDPENFRPERFFDEHGRLIKDYSLPFGMGKRQCAGETFARFIVFVLFATLLQHYDFYFVDGEPTGLNDKIPGLTTQSKRTWIRLKPRH